MEEEWHYTSTNTFTKVNSCSHITSTSAAIRWQQRIAHVPSIQSSSASASSSSTSSPQSEHLIIRFAAHQHAAVVAVAHFVSANGSETMCTLPPTMQGAPAHPLSVALNWRVESRSDCGALQLVLDAQSAAHHEQSRRFLARFQLQSVSVQVSVRRGVAVDCNLRNILSFFSSSSSFGSSSSVSSSATAQGIVGRSYLRESARLIDESDRLAKVAAVLEQLTDDERRAFGLGTHSAAQLRAQSQRLLERVRRRKKSMHHAVVAFLFRRFDVILWPKLDTKQLFRRARRRFGSAITRLASLAISHGELLEYAKRYASQCRGKQVLTDSDGVSEAYSTISCSSCGSRRQSFAHEHFSCPSCHLEANRDLNAAKNIFLANFHLLLIIGPVSAHPP